jgi:hypothetical protein
VLNEDFLSGLEDLPLLQSQQKTFMEIAGYAHSENACSKILQFYLTPTNEHGFGRLLLDSLVAIIDRELINDKQNIEVFREVRTTEGKRIDLIIVSDDYVIGIENKIFAEVNNPFCDYTIHLNSLGGKFKKVYKVLLSLRAEEESIELCGFKPITYDSLLNNIEEKLESYSQNMPNEHLTFLKDFIRTMRNLQKQSNVDPQWLKYFQDKDNDIKKLLTEIAVLRKDMRMKLEQLEQLIVELEISAHFTERWFWTHPTFVGDMLIYTIDPGKSSLSFAIILTPVGWKMQFWNKQTDLEKNTGIEKERLKKCFDERIAGCKEVTGWEERGWRLEFDGFKDKAYETTLEEITESVVAIWNQLDKKMEE